MNKEIIDYQAKWDSLSLESDYIIACELLQLYEAGNLKELGAFLQKNKAMQQRRAEVELERYLKDLMEIIILWKFNNNFHTDENMAKINMLRMNINNMIECEGCLSEQNIKQFWREAFDYAKSWTSARLMETEILQDLSWDEVFNQDYIYHG